MIGSEGEIKVSGIGEVIIIVEILKGKDDTIYVIVNFIKVSEIEVSEMFKTILLYIVIYE